MVLYDYPEYHEVAFSFRDINREVEFIRHCIDRFSEIPVSDILEIACGSAPHAEALTDHGYRYLGLDNNRNMLDYAQNKWQHLNPPAEFIEGDMVSFEVTSRVDFALIMLGSLYANTTEEMTSHFDSMARALNVGGLYFLDWCIQYTDPLEFKENNAFRIERDGIKVESRFNIRLADAARQMYEEVCTVDVNDRGQHRVFKMIEHNRAILPQKFLRFIECRKDFELVGSWRDWNFDKPIKDREEIIRPVAVVRRIRS